MSDVDSAEFVGLVKSARSAAMDAVAAGAITREFVATSKDGLVQGSLVIAAEIEALECSGPIFLCAFSTDWSALIDSAEVVGGPRPSVVLKLRQVSDSPKFLQARLSMAAQCICAAMREAPGCGQIVIRKDRDVALQWLRESLVVKSLAAIRTWLDQGDQTAEIGGAVHCLIAHEFFDGEPERADSIDVEGLYFNLAHPQTMPSEYFAPLSGVAAKLRGRIEQGDDSACLCKVRDDLEAILERAPWTFSPSTGVQPKDVELPRERG